MHLPPLLCPVHVSLPAADSAPCRKGHADVNCNMQAAEYSTHDQADKLARRVCICAHRRLQGDDIQDHSVAGGEQANILQCADCQVTGKQYGSPYPSESIGLIVVNFQRQAACDTRSSPFLPLSIMIGAPVQGKGTLPEVLAVFETCAESVLPDATGIDITHSDLLRHLQDCTGYAHYQPLRHVDRSGLEYCILRKSAPFAPEMPHAFTAFICYYGTGRRRQRQR